MKVDLDITQNLLEQFIHYFDLKREGDYYPINPALGTGGGIRYIQFPGQLEFYHFGSTLFKQDIEMTSVNPENTQWFIIHINLSLTKQEKQVNGQTLRFQKHLPIGLLLYGPKLEIFTRIPANVESEVATIRFSKNFLKHYFEEISTAIDFGKSLTYEDLDPVLEGSVSKAIEAMDNKLKCHTHILEFLSRYFEKISMHERTKTLEKIHPTDIQGLFRVATLLRDPLNGELPGIKELAAIAAMGTTKFKTLFRQVFGNPPVEYHHRIRMEFAYEELQTKGKTPTEVSFQLGYSHPSNFTAAYKKFFGHLPSSMH